jgi:uncharacterized protein YgbK (DUF1537 family)
MYKLGVIADDFTGANDVGVQFKKQWLRTIVLTDIRSIKSVMDEADVIVIDTESRMQPPSIAYEKVKRTARALKKLGVKIIYKKVDSTLRGNIGAEIEAVMDALETRLSVVAPAFPSNSRVTVGGYQLVNSKPITQTDFAYDPINPVEESHVPTLIQTQTKRKVGYVTLSTVRAGLQSLKDEILMQQRMGKEIIVADAETQDDLKLIGDATVNLDALPCGSAGLADGIARALRLPSRSMLVISGSVNNVTMQQISKARKVLNAHVIELDTLNLIKGEKRKELRKVIDKAIIAANEGKDVIIKSAKSREHATKTLRYGKKMGLTEIEISEKIFSCLGEICEAIVKKGKIGGIALFGGSTAIKIIKRFGALGTKIEGEVSPGVPFCRIVGGKYNNLQVVTKAGGFGDEDIVTKIANCIKRYH